MRGADQVGVGLRLGSFQLQERLAAGGTGEVWRGVHEATALPVAVKLLPEAARPDLQRSFQREVRAVASLSHPHVIAVLDAGEISSDASGATKGRWAPGTPWMALELCSGGTLYQAPPANFPALRMVLLQILDALGHAHARGVVHRDLKPSNVLWCGPTDSRPGLKLSDFGVAALASTDEDDPTFLAPSAGTPSFMAPEQLLGEPRHIGPWTDLYALGCLAWALCAGKSPFQRKSAMGTARAHLNGERPAFVCPFDVPPDFEVWLDALLQRSWSARPECAADAAHALRNVVVDDGGLEDEVTAEMELPVRVREDEPTRRNFLDEDELIEAALGGPIPDASDERLPPPPMLGTVHEARGDTAVLHGAGLGLLGVRHPPLVGRDRAVDVIWRELGFVHRSRRPRVIDLRGTRGVGRTWLLRTLAWRAAEVGGFEVLTVPRGMEPLARMTAMRFRLETLGGPERVRALEEEGFDEEEVASLEALLDGVLPAEARVGVAARVVEHLGRRRPVLLCIDDAERQAEGLALLQRLVERRAAVAGLVTVEPGALLERPEEARLLDNLDALQLELPPLPPEAMKDVAHGLVTLETELTRRIVAESRGRPAFVVELLRAWAEQGWLLPGADGFRLPEDVPLALPADVQDAWRRRVSHLVERLEPASGWDLHVAAALGLEVEERIWHTACDDPDGEGHGWSSEGVRRRQRLVDALIRAQLVVERPHGFAFAHRTLLEHLCGEAREKGRWMLLHRACARALQVHGVDAPGRVGRHLQEGGRPADAVEPLLIAGTTSLRTNPRQALAYVRRAEEAAHDAELDPTESRSGQLLVARAEGHLANGEPEESIRWARWAQQAARTHGPEHTGTAEMVWWRVLRTSMQLELDALLQLDRREEAAAILPKLAPVVRKLRDPAPWGDLLVAQASIQASLSDGVPVALGLLDEAVLRFHAAGRQDRAARAEQLAARLERRLGGGAEALARVDRALGEGAGGDRVLLGELNVLRAELLAELGALEQASDVLARGRAVLGSLGRSSTRGDVLDAVLESLLGRVQEGATMAARAASPGQRPSERALVSVARALTVARARRWGEVARHVEAVDALGLPEDGLARWIARRFEAECDTAGFAQLRIRARRWPS